MIGFLLPVVLGIAKNFLPSAAGNFIGDTLRPFVEGMNDERKHRHLETIEEIKTRRDIIVAEQGWWATAMIRPAIAWLFILHIGAVVLDSTFPPFGSWGIPALPKPYDEYEMWIVLAYFGGRPIEKLARSIRR